MVQAGGVRLDGVGPWGRRAARQWLTLFQRVWSAKRTGRQRPRASALRFLAAQAARHAAAAWRNFASETMSESGELPRETLIDLYRVMVRIRAFEESVRRFHGGRQGAGLGSPLHRAGGGAGWLHVGAAARRLHRHLSQGPRALHRQGSPMDQLLGELLHRQGGLNQGRAGEPHLCDPATRNLGSTGIVGGSAPLAAGAALAAKLRGSGEASVSFFGDGALNQGVLFEVLNMAAIWSLPLVFVCEDNRYGEFTEGAKVTAGASYAVRGAMFGIPARMVDGMDVLAVRAAAAQALDRARSGQGPSFLVCEPTASPATM